MRLEEQIKKLQQAKSLRKVKRTENKDPKKTTRDKSDYATGRNKSKDIAKNTTQKVSRQGQAI